MKFHCIIKNRRTGKCEALITFAPLAIGSIIKWGADGEAWDGLAAWIVIDCFAV